MAAMKPRVTLLDYGAGNVRSVVNALELLGCDVSLVRTAADVLGAEILVFPGVGCFGAAMDALEALDVADALRAYLGDADRPFLGICLGMQLLFGASEETPGARGLGVVDGDVTLFEPSDGAVVPSMGWNEALGLDPAAGLFEPRERYYFVHSYKVSRCDPAWRATVTDYGGVRYTSALANGRRVACQFHPEKSGPKGLALLDRFVTRSRGATALPSLGAPLPSSTTTLMAPRVISALDVRSNDDGDLVVTKGDGYDVREKAEGGAVRNLGKPVDLCARYYDEGAAIRDHRMDQEAKQKKLFGDQFDHLRDIAISSLVDITGLKIRLGMIDMFYCGEATVVSNHQSTAPHAFAYETAGLDDLATMSLSLIHI